MTKIPWVFFVYCCTYCDGNKIHKKSWELSEGKRLWLETEIFRKAPTESTRGIQKQNPMTRFKDKMAFQFFFLAYTYNLQEFFFNSHFHIILFYSFFSYILNFDICFERTYISFKLWLIRYLVFGVAHVSLNNERDAHFKG